MHNIHLINLLTRKWYINNLVYPRKWYICICFHFHENAMLRQQFFLFLRTHFWNNFIIDLHIDTALYNYCHLNCYWRYIGYIFFVALWVLRGIFEKLVVFRKFLTLILLSNFHPKFQHSAVFHWTSIRIRIRGHAQST